MQRTSIIRLEMWFQPALIFNMDNLQRGIEFLSKFTYA